MTMTIGQVLDQIQYRLAHQKGSTGWLTQRPVVRGMLDTSIALLSDEFRDRMRYVPNVLLEPHERGHYDEPSTITAFRRPDDCDPNKIEDLSVNWAGLWHSLPKGITSSMRDFSYATTPTFLAWDVTEGGNIEVWPHPDEWHEVRVTYTRRATDYMNDDESECVDADEQLLILLTLDTAIPFYGRPDGEMNNRHLNRHLGNIKANQLSGIRFIKGRAPNTGTTPDRADQIYTVPYRPTTRAG